MTDNRSPKLYRGLKVMYVSISLALLVVAYCLVRGWPFDPETKFLGVSLRYSGVALAVAAGVHALPILLRAIFQPGRKSIWWF